VNSRRNNDLPNIMQVYRFNPSKVNYGIQRVRGINPEDWNCHTKASSSPSNSIVEIKFISFSHMRKSLLSTNL
jgi:hypothetical protein